MLIGSLDLVKIGKRLGKVDSFLLDVLGVRLASGGLSDYVAEVKRRQSGGGVFDIKRQEIEDRRIERMKEWAGEKGIDPNFAAAIMHQLISESCRVQDAIMVGRIKDETGIIDEEREEDVYAFQRKDLLRLTEAVATKYDKKYAEDFFGTGLYVDFEQKILNKLITGLADKEMAIDLGCATGIMSFLMSPHFKKVVGFDISPDMIRVAKEKRTRISAHLDFVQKDIEEGCGLDKNSVDLAVMNMGTASEIKNIEKILKELKSCLRSKGKFLFSFYNSESLLAELGFLPWPTPLAAYVDPDKRFLEVHYEKNVYFLYAQPRSVEEINKLLFDFNIESIYSYPTCASVLPNAILTDEDDKGNRQPNKAQLLISNIDYALASSGLNSGTYIIVTGCKK